MNAPSIVLVCALGLVPAGPRENAFELALARAEDALEGARLDDAAAAIREALERDGKSWAAWELEARRAQAAGETDERIYALHRTLALSVAQARDEDEIDALRASLLDEDPLAERLFGLRDDHLAELLPLAEGYEELGWRHAAIRVHKEVLALDPARRKSEEAIQRLASAPDPSLAEDAQPADLLAGVSQAWIDAHDAEHGTWKERAKVERENYVTETDAGYAVLVRAAEAMEQMNAFYRTFFDYGAEGDGRKVPRIRLLIFKSKEEYLEHGTGPPVEWSGGQFTGGTVETYVGDVPFEAMTGTLFHEAAHQFVSLATNAAGWMNEGLASFFEGTRVLSNGTVVMNLPANGRLFPLVERMERGFMADSKEGFDSGDPNVVPEKAPTFRLVLENEYEWGPAWYGPTWGVVYFLYNYQDPSDGRFVYRNAFREYVDKSGGRVGRGAVSTFEEVVLANPEPPTQGTRNTAALPATVDELNPLWKEWLVALRDEQSGKLEADRPYVDWARNAARRGDSAAALELFEKGLRAAPEDPELLAAFGEFLIAEEDEDRAAKLMRRARILLEAEEPDAALLAELDEVLERIDPQLEELREIRAKLVAEAQEIVDGYLAAELEHMAMDVSLALGTQFSIPALFDRYEDAVRRQGSALALWRLAYDGESLRGWNASGDGVFEARGEEIVAELGEYETGVFDYRFLTLDEVTSGDFSIEAEVRARNGEVAFAGLVFGKKSTDDFHALVLFPPALDKKANLDLASFYGGGSHKTWRHNPVEGHPGEAESWYHLRVDVTGRIADAWVDGRRIASQEFPSVDVLRGGFGLFTGVGEARFRDVRYLARHPGDPAARIEREVLHENEAAAARGATGRAASRDGSWIGLEPPFPTVSEWIQDRPRRGWEDGLGRPQLLVLWSIQQNEAVQIHTWLAHLAEEYAPVGLRIVTVGLCWDADKVRDYVDAKSFPGSIGIDRVAPNGKVGKTFDDYSIDRFYLPRLVLLDVDGKAVWEGDPGFSAGRPWKGQESFLHDPLQDLVAKRRLGEVVEWRGRWAEAGAPALEAGRVEEAIPLLREAESFDPELFPDVGRAVESLRALERTVADVDALRAHLTEAGAEPAFETLAEWAELADVPLASNRETRKLAKSTAAKDWKRALSMLKSTKRRIDGGKDPGSMDGVLERMEPLTGALPARLRDELRAAGDDPERIAAVVLGAEDLPARWLAEWIFAE